MNAIEQGLIVSDLNAARGNASLAQSHLTGARQLARIHGLDCTPINLANYHFAEAAKLIDQALGKKETPVAPTPVAQTAGSAVPQAAGLPEQSAADESPSEPAIENPHSSIINHQ